jgi:hypothetical protein
MKPSASGGSDGAQPGWPGPSAVASVAGLSSGT